MQLKIGHIYKVSATRHGKEIEIRGILIQQKEYHDHTFNYLFITTTGKYEDVDSEKIIKLSSTKMEEDLRNALKDVCKKEMEKQKIQAKIKEMENELRNKNQEINEQRTGLKDISKEYALTDIASQLQHMHAVDNENQHFSFSIEKYVTKYATPSQYDFLYTEYDGSLFISDYEACIKECGIELFTSAIESLKRQLQHTTLEKVEDGAFLGDKNTLYTEKTFHFQLKKKFDYNAILEECKIIQEWAKKQQEKVYNPYVY